MSLQPQAAAGATRLPQRVAITGMSVACALGFDLERFWTSLLEGRSGIRRVDFVPADVPLPVRIAGQIDGPAWAEATAACGIDDPDRGTQLALYAIQRALEDARLPTDGAQPLDLDLIVGTGHANVQYHNQAVQTFLEGGYRKIRPTTVVRLMFNRPASVASIRHRLTGSSHVVSVACASAAVALGDAFHRVRFGLADGVVVAGADSGLDLMTFAAWNRLGVLSRNPDPVRASRPFDRQRDGLVMGEGAAGFVLESFESAERRGVPVRAEVAGYGATSDATHLVRPNAVTQAQAIRKALASASMSPEQIDYVNAHGTATVPADITETASLLEALGGHGRQVPVANSKGQLGHLMGAAAGIELVATILALQRQVIAPCRNLDDPDPGCPLNFVRHQPLAARVSCALKNCFAFGGTNSVVVLKQAPSAPAPSAPAAPRFHNL